MSHIKLITVFLALSALVSSATANELVYQGSFPTNQNWSDAFQWAPPSDGKLILTIDNPDGSSDGTVALLDGAHWYDAQNFLFVPYLPQGVQHSVFEMDVKQSWGSRPWLWLTNQTSNAGTDSLTLEFAAGSVSDQSKTYLGTLTSGPQEQNSGEWSFDLASPGKLLFNVTKLGSGGGAHLVSLDGVPVLDLRVGWDSPPPEWSSIEVPVGHHTVQLEHVDNPFGDNTGIRETQVYLTPDPATLSLLALGGMAILMRRK